jgi:hypothetical protein
MLLLEMPLSTRASSLRRVPGLLESPRRLLRLRHQPRRETPRPAGEPGPRIRHRSSHARTLGPRVRSTTPHIPWLHGIGCDCGILPLRSSAGQRLVGFEGPPVGRTRFMQAMIHRKARRGGQIRGPRWLARGRRPRTRPEIRRGSVRLPGSPIRRPPARVFPRNKPVRPDVPQLQTGKASDFDFMGNTIEVSASGKLLRTRPHLFAERYPWSKRTRIRGHHDPLHPNTFRQSMF